MKIDVIAHILPILTRFSINAIEIYYFLLPRIYIIVEECRELYQILAAVTTRCSVVSRDGIFWLLGEKIKSDLILHLKNYDINFNTFLIISMKSGVQCK